MANLKNTKPAKTKANEATEEVKIETPDVQPEVSVEVPDVTVEVPENTVAPTETENGDEVVAEAPEVNAVPDKKVKVKLIKDHKCHIGIENYHFIAGKVYTVPQNVKSILQKAGLLTAL